MNSVNEDRDRKLFDAVMQEDKDRSWTENKDSTAFEQYQNKEKLQQLSTSQVKAIHALPVTHMDAYLQQ